MSRSTTFKAVGWWRSRGDMTWHGDKRLGRKERQEKLWLRDRISIRSERSQRSLGRSVVLMRLGSRKLKESFGKVEIIEGIQCLPHSFFQLALWSRHNSLDVRNAEVMLCWFFSLTETLPYHWFCYFYNLFLCNTSFVDYGCFLKDTNFFFFA